jgi:hypothetical protein
MRTLVGRTKGKMNLYTFTLSTGTKFRSKDFLIGSRADGRCLTLPGRRQCVEMNAFSQSI